MDKIRTLLVDDELPARRRVLDLLEKQDDIEVTGMARDGREAVDRIRDSRPDLMFLDIQMPNLDGFGVLQALFAPSQVTVLLAGQTRGLITGNLERQCKPSTCHKRCYH